MGKYIAINGCFRAEANYVGLVATADSLEEAKEICQNEIAEDYSYDTFEKFQEEEAPLILEYEDTEKHYDNLVYELSLNQYEHSEVYRVYHLRA